MSTPEKEGEFNSERDIPKLFVHAIGALAIRDEAADFLERVETSPFSRDIKIGVGHIEHGDHVELALFGYARGVRYGLTASEYRGQGVSRSRYGYYSRVISGTVSASGSNVKLRDSFMEYQRGAVRDNFNVKGIVKQLLSIDATYQPDTLAQIAVERGDSGVPDSLKSSYHSQAAEAFIEMGHASTLVDHLAAKPESAGYGEFVRALNRRVTALYNLAERATLQSSIIRYQSSANELLRLLDEHSLVQAEHLWSVKLLADPYVASVIASTEKLGEMFDGLSSHARRQMSILLTEKLLSSYAQPESDRNQRNAALIKKVLFNEKSYRRDIPLLEFIKLANQFTARINQSKPAEEKQALLPEDGIGTTMLLNSGEALFRILNMTNALPEHVEQNRDIATIFDAMLEADYRKYAKTRPVTVADICARYPDAKGDLVLELQDSAKVDGYSAASRLYKTVRRQQGKAVFFNKRKPGKGIIS